MTGYSQFLLKKAGEMLTVDRIDASLGYVEGNMQLMASGLNKAKGARREVPSWAVKSLRRRVDRLKYDIYSEKPCAE